ncbi:MAG: TMEM143 family protein [Desulfobacterales bacterium]
MNEQKRRGRFIPFRKSDLVTMCLEAGLIMEGTAADFHDFHRLLGALLHFEYHQLLESIKDAYAPFDPDADTRPIRPPDQETLVTHQTTFVGQMTTLLDAANFEPITKEDLHEALAEESLFKIRLEVDFEDFEEVLFFRRGENLRQETLVSWAGLKKTPVTFTNFDRVVVYIKFKPAAYFAAAGRKKLPYKPGATMIKLFQNVPKADLEMLFPNSEVRMKTIDKLIIGIPAAVSGAVVLVSRLGASLVLVGSLVAFWLGLRETSVEINQKHLVALGLGLAALGGFSFKQVSKFKNRKIRFMKALAENLYFKNLDNNAGVFHHLIDAAEEEEFKEALLAYLYLARSANGLTRRQLDEAVESWLAEEWDCPIDFEVDDALEKLQRWGLLKREGERFCALSLPEAKARLDQIWDNYFTYHQARAQ